FTLKQLTAIAKVKDNNPTKIGFLKTKHYIEPFEVGNIIYLSEKFIAYETYYLVNATLIKVVDLNCNDILAIGLNIMISAQTTQTVKI
ncbi:32209_t:CDS:2, partial [Gigaspora margarita]